MNRMDSIKILIINLFAEVEPAFPYRDVIVRRNIEFKEYYDLQSELGR